MPKRVDYEGEGKKEINSYVPRISTATAEGIFPSRGEINRSIGIPVGPSCTQISRDVLRKLYFIHIIRFQY